jgi:hypothetical protein
VRKNCKFYLKANTKSSPVTIQEIPGNNKRAGRLPWGLFKVAAPEGFALPAGHELHELARKISEIRVICVKALDFAR